MKSERRGSWYLLTGVVLGVAMGLIYSWVISPVKYVDAPPYALRADYKEEYRALVAAAYLYSGDLVRAQDRLAQLKDDKPAESVAMQAQRALAEGHPEAEVKALSLLALALSQGVTPAAPGLNATQVSTPSPAGNSVSLPSVVNQPADNPAGEQVANAVGQESSITPDPLNTLGASPIITSTLNSGVSFVLQNNTLTCNINQPGPLIQAEIIDAAGQPVPNMELLVTWEAGQDHFFTGLKPDLGLGYGDFLMTPGTVYSVRLGNGGPVVNDISASECVAEDGSHYWGSWLLTFNQP
jgi:hypothetical protein